VTATKINIWSTFLQGNREQTHIEIILKIGLKLDKERGRNFGVFQNANSI
jgi:hypothetical protein